MHVGFEKVSMRNVVMFAELLHCLIGKGQLNVSWVVYLLRVLQFNNVAMNYTDCS
jgi:hypothetical protein